MSFVSSYLTSNRIGVLPEEVFTTSTSLLYLYVRDQSGWVFILCWLKKRAFRVDVQLSLFYTRKRKVEKEQEKVSKHEHRK